MEAMKNMDHLFVKEVKEKIKLLDDLGITKDMEAMKNMDYPFVKEVKEKIKLLDDFGITKDMIPTNYFAGCRSQRDIDIRAEHLISKKLFLYDAANCKKNKEVIA